MSEELANTPAQQTPTEPTPDTTKQTTSEPPAEGSNDNQGASDQAGQDGENGQQKTEPSEADKVKHGMQKRVDKLTARLADREKALQSALEELQRHSKPQQKEGAPREEDFDSLEDYLKAQGKYEARQEYEQKQLEEKQKAANAAREQQIQAKRAAFAEQEAALKAEKPDYDEAVSAVNEFIEDVDPRSGGMKVFGNLMLAMENLPAMTYHLGKNPEVCQKLKDCKSEIDMARILFIEEYKLQNAPKTKQTQTQPTPPRPLGGSSKGGKSEDELSGRELRKKAGLI